MIPTSRTHPPILLITIFVASVISCNKDEVFYNHNAAPPKVTSLSIPNLKEGQHVDGTIHFQYMPENTSPPFIGITVFVDSVAITNSLYTLPPDVPYEIIIDSRLWPEGNHLISIGEVKFKAPEIGMLSLAMFPYKICSINLVFDRKPPTAVVLQSVTWNETAKAPLLSWSKNTDQNFLAYHIFRNYQSNYYAAGTIFDRNQTSFVDTWNNGAIGFNCTYSIVVDNGYQTVTSNEVNFSVPNTIINAAPNVGFNSMIFSASRSELYVLEYNSIKAISATTHQVLRTYNTNYNYQSHFVMSKDESKIYVASVYSPNFIILDAASFDVIKTVDLNFGIGEMVYGRENRLYVINTWGNGSLKILDATTGNQLGEADIKAPSGLLCISSDNNTLYVADQSLTAYQTAKVYKVDVSTDEPHLLLTKVAADQVRRIQLSTDGTKLFLINEQDYPAPVSNYVDCWDPNTLTSVAKYTIPNQVFDFSVNATSLYVIGGERYLQYFVPGSIAEFNIDTRQITKAWNFVQAPKSILCKPDNSGMYVFGYNFWYINH